MMLHRRDFLLGLASGSASWGQEPRLLYQDRNRRYREGVRTVPSSGSSIDLVAALIDSGSPDFGTGPDFSMAFRLPNADSPSLTVREITPRYFYWLDNVADAKDWSPLARTQFTWPTKTVIDALRWMDGGPLRLKDLGAVIRLGRTTPGDIETIVPVSLGFGHAGLRTKFYRFVFRPVAAMDLTFELFAEGSNAKRLQSQHFNNVLGSEPKLVEFNASSWRETWYRLVVSGDVRSGNSQTYYALRFFHNKSL